jgi:HNH endonuclease
MPASVKWLSDPTNIEDAVALYRDIDRLLTIEGIATLMGTRFHNVQAALNVMPPKERKALAALRYSASKVGDLNPMTGKVLHEHHNWKGQCTDQRGYTTEKTESGREFVHRTHMAQVLGLDRLPERVVVHHLDGDGENNSLDNLAVMTEEAHRRWHSYQREPSQVALRRGLTLAAATRSLISPSKKTKVT